MAPEPVDDHNQNSYNEPNFQTAINVITVGSSSEEDEALTLENEGYQLLPQGPDQLDEDPIDYNSLSGLMAALNTNGPNIIQDTEASENAGTAGNTNAEQKSLESSSQSLKKIVAQSDKEREDYVKEQASIWKSCTGSNEITMDEDKETEIKRVMSRIQLPNAAVPTWAKEISDEEWKCHILSVFGNKFRLPEN